MSIIRYQTPSLSASLTPFARLSSTFQEDVDRLFDLPFFGRESRATAGAAALDVYQDKDQFIVKAELPGLKKEDIAISLHEGVLTLAGERRQEKEHDEKNCVRNERWFGRFERTVNLPAPVDATRVAATYEDGVLTVTLPKAEQAKPRQIEIQAH
jgi:HSP20 family protein